MVDQNWFNKACPAGHGITEHRAGGGSSSPPAPALRQGLDCWNAFGFRPGSDFSRWGRSPDMQVRWRPSTKSQRGTGSSLDAGAQEPVNGDRAEPPPVSTELEFDQA